MNEAEIIALARTLEPEMLRQLADEAAASGRAECTGIAATWCPIHGDCTCLAYLRNEAIRDGDPLAEESDELDYRDSGASDPDCPLHSLVSTHP